MGQSGRGCRELWTIHAYYHQSDKENLGNPNLELLRHLDLKIC